MHGAVDVDRDVVLSWNPGDGATAHSVYFGADDPGNMVLQSGQPQVGTTFDPPGSLDLGTTYYWSVVEYPGGETGRTWKFTTSEYRVLDDMESYVIWSNPAGPHIFVAWRDGFGDCSTGSGNDTGAVLTEVPSPALGGIQSMKYEFDNDGTVYSPCTMGLVTGRLKYSRIEAQTATLPSGIGSDWKVGGVKALYVPFYGQAGNATTESLWVQLQDGAKGYGEKVFYGTYEGESLDDLADESWHEWYIDLADFDVDLSNVVSIVIGIGDEAAKDTAFGSGTLYFDEMRLYVPRCVPSRHSEEFARLDFAPLGAPDCIVNYKELDVMADDWLLTDALETGELLVRWEFNSTAGTTALDSSGNGRNGDVNDTSGSSWVYDATRGWCLDFNDGDFVLDNDASQYLNDLRGLTIAVWVKNRETTATDQGFIIFDDPAGDDDRDMRYDAAGATGSGVSVIKCGVTTTSAVGEPIQQLESSEYAQTTAWQHLALTWSTGEQLKLYIDGVLDTPTQNDDQGWYGLIDDVQIYNHALSAAEIATVKAGGTIPDKDIHYPVSSPAEIYEGEALGSRVVNFKDYAELMDSWLLEMKYPR